MSRPRIAQSYSHPVARQRMSEGDCPECGEKPRQHSSVVEFWMRSPGCNLVPQGVVDRIAQYRAEEADGG